MEIQIYNQNSVTPLTSSDAVIFKAIESQLVNNISDDTLKAKLLELVYNSHLTAGIKAPENKTELNITLTEILKEQRRNKTNIRIDEIEIAFKNGIHKKYGDYFGLNAVTFCMFIREYLKEETRAEALRIKNMPKEDKTPSEKEIHDLCVENCKSAYKELKINGSVGRFGVIVYDFLTKENILVLDNETKWQYYEDAKLALQEYIQSQIYNANDKHEVNRLKNNLNLLIENAKSETNEQKLITISKRLAVDDYFRGLEIEGLTIDEVLI